MGGTEQTQSVFVLAAKMALKQEQLEALIKLRNDLLPDLKPSYLTMFDRLIGQLSDEVTHARLVHKYDDLTGAKIIPGIKAEHI